MTRWYDKLSEAERENRIDFLRNLLNNLADAFGSSHPSERRVKEYFKMFGMVDREILLEAAEIARFMGEEFPSPKAFRSAIWEATARRSEGEGELECERCGSTGLFFYHIKLDDGRLSPQFIARCSCPLGLKYRDCPVMWDQVVAKHGREKLIELRDLDDFRYFVANRHSVMRIDEWKELNAVPF